VNGCSAYLKAGDKLSVFDLTHGMMLPSGNDASHQLAEYFGNVLWGANIRNKRKPCSSPVEYFLQEGNKMLRDELGLKNTHYASPHGLSNNMNKTTCYDMAIITINTLKSNACRKVAAQLDYRCRSRVKGIPTDESMLGEAYDTRRYHWPIGQVLELAQFKTHPKIQRLHGRRPKKYEDSEMETNEYYWHQEHHQVMHEGFGCIGGKNGGTPSALKCMTSLFEQQNVTIEGK
jgi:D-alanyl-D-alanine carboxypeptidase